MKIKQLHRIKDECLLDLKQAPDAFNATSINQIAVFLAVISRKRDLPQVFGH